MKALLFTILVLLAFNSTCANYKLVLHSQERGAACLDGSPAGFYIHEGSNENKNKFLLYFNGGGFCGGSTLA